MRLRFLITENFDLNFPTISATAGKTLKRNEINKKINFHLIFLDIFILIQFFPTCTKKASRGHRGGGSGGAVNIPGPRANHFCAPPPCLSRSLKMIERKRVFVSNYQQNVEKWQNFRFVTPSTCVMQKDQHTFRPQSAIVHSVQQFLNSVSIDFFACGCHFCGPSTTMLLHTQFFNATVQRDIFRRVLYRILCLDGVQLSPKSFVSRKSNSKSDKFDDNM